MDDNYEINGNIIKIDSAILGGEKGKNSSLKICGEDNFIY
jgi:hypothetical protein